MFFVGSGPSSNKQKIKNPLEIMKNLDLYSFITSQLIPVVVFEED
jgi:hypothetical protein